MIVDGHVHLSDDPEPARGWPPFTADDLIAIMDEELPIPGGPRVIDRAAVMPMLGPTQRADLSFREQHRPVIEAVREYPDPVLEEAASLDIPVLIHTGDPPFAVPALMEPLAADHPRTTVILAHLGTQKIGYADDAINVARHCDNVYLETGWGHQPRVAEAVRTIGADRMVFGSDCPVQDPYSQLRIIQTLTRDGPLGINLSEPDMEAIMGNNLARLLRL